MRRENREHHRHQFEMPAGIETADGSRIEATVCDLSQGGACLKVANCATLPDEFHLALSKDIRRRCRVAWRGDGQVGVKFVAAAQAATKRNSRSPVFIKCPRTGRAIATGIELLGSNDLSGIPQTRRYTPCRHCKVVHGWMPTEAFIDKTSS